MRVLRNRLPIIRGLCLRLAYARNRNTVRSDLKPVNVFLKAGGQVRILDFGIARAAPAAERMGASDAPRNEGGDCDAGELGALTPFYAACEMFEGQPPDPADYRLPRRMGAANEGTRKPC